MLARGAMRSVRRARFMVLLAAVLCLAAPAHVSALRNANVTVEIDLSFLNNAFLRELTVVTDGVVESSVIDAAQTIPIPGSLALAQLRWMTTKPMSQVKYTIGLSTTATDDQLQLTVPTGTSGVLNQTEIPLSVHHLCKANGVYSVSLSIGMVLDDGSNETLSPLDVTYRKQCDLEAQSLAGLPAFCQPNTAGAGLPARYGAVRVATFDVYRFPGAQVSAKVDAIVAAITAADVDVVVLQQVFGSDAQDLLSSRLSTTFQYIVPQIRGTSTAESGLFIASKLRPRRCQFSQFVASHGSDSLLSKGIFGILLDAGAGYSTFIFTAHMQHGTSAADVTARTAQMVQAADFISAQTAAVATGTGSDSANFGGSRTSRMGVIAAGNFNTNGITYGADDTFQAIGSTELTTVLNTLNSAGITARDLYRELNPTTPGYTTMAYNVTCASAETTIEFSCDAGQTLTFPGSRVDYLFSFNNVPSAVGALALNDLQVSDAVTLDLADDSYNFVTLGGATFNTVSYHKMVHVTVTHSAQVDNGAGSARHRGDMFLSSAFVVLAMLVSTLMCWPSAE